MEEIINDLDSLKECEDDKRVNRILKIANTQGALANYGLNALRAARGGKLRMNVFLQDMRRVNVEMMTMEDMDRFLQGDEDIQIEVLQRLEDKGGVFTADVKVDTISTTLTQPKINAEVISHMSGLTPEQTKEAFAGELDKPLEFTPTAVHEWKLPAGSRMKFCTKCGLEKETLQLEDATSVCSEKWNLY